MGPVTGRVVLALATGLDSYQATVLHGARMALQERGVALLAHVHHGPASALLPALSRALDRRPPCGVITTNPLPPRQEAALRDLVAARGLPVVHLGQDLAGESCVRADNVHGMTALMGHLLDERGSRSPALVRGSTDQPDHVDREAVFRRELARRGLAVDEGLVLEGRCEAEIARTEVRRLLRRRRDLDAVVTMDDWSAFVVQEALAEAGLRVPDDVAVTGFDDFPIASLTWPGLTTVGQDLVGQGATAARLLLDLLDGTAEPRHVLTPCRLIVRGSTAGTCAPAAGEGAAIEAVARSAREHLAAQSALTRMSCALNACRTVEEVCDALVSGLGSLGVRRSFLVIHEGDGQPVPQPEGDLPQRSRLLLDYRDGRAHPCPDATFSPGQVLPDHLADEAATGFLAVQPLAVSRGVLGHLLVEYTHGPLPIAESLRLDLGRTLEAIFSTRDLQAHLAELEQLVARRTGELEAEIATRREAQRRLQVANAELQRTASIDGLTRIANRAAFQRRLEALWSGAAGDGGQLAVVMLDVDVFKAYNDRYGHLLGDEALRVVATCLSQAARGPDDLACRFGGEEFVMLLPDTDLDGALDVARGVRRSLAEAAVPHDASHLSDVITASMGVCAVTPRADLSPDVLLDAADRALYRAKEAGRDRIVVGHVSPAAHGAGLAPTGAPAHRARAAAGTDGTPASGGPPAEPSPL